jgi:hypothetical protein
MPSQVSIARCFVVNSNDNVATLLDDGEPGPLQILGSAQCDPIELRESIKLGHKVALKDIPNGQPVTKFGETIGRATRAIARGSWVHLHNVTSEFDERSQTLDVNTGAVTDTSYQ